MCTSLLYITVKPTYMSKLTTLYGKLVVRRQKYGLESVSTKSLSYISKWKVYSLFSYSKMAAGHDSKQKLQDTQCNCHETLAYHYQQNSNCHVPVEALSRTTSYCHVPAETLACTISYWHVPLGASRGAVTYH